jgi:hypothetical protein
MKNTFITVTLFTLAACTPAHGLPAFDGVMSAGEWDGYFLGTSTHNNNWDTGDYVTCNVYAFNDATSLYVAWEMVDCTTGSWDTAKAVGVEAQLYIKCPSSASYPDPGYDLLDMKNLVLKQTDGVGWTDVGSLSDNGIAYGYTHESSPDRIGVAEFQIAWTAFTEGIQPELAFVGQYWGYGFETNAVTYTTEMPAPIPEPAGLGLLGLGLLGVTRRKRRN